MTSTDLLGLRARKGNRVLIARTAAGPAYAAALDPDTASHLLLQMDQDAPKDAERLRSRLELNRLTLLLLSVRHTFAMPAVVANSDLIATVSRSVASEFEKYPNLRILPLPIPGPRIRIAQHWSARFAQDPAIGWLRTLIREIFQEKIGSKRR